MTAGAEVKTCACGKKFLSYGEKICSRCRDEVK